MNEEPDFTPSASAYAPAYGLTASAAGPQCSASSDFCFFCEFQTAGIVGEMKALVHTLAADGKELPVIAEAVRRAYEDGIRAETVWTPAECPPVTGPEWTLASIKRHLVFSTEFSELFDSAVTQMFHSLIAAQNDVMVDRATGMVVEQHRSGFVDTVNTFIRWTKHRDAKKS